jgi:hypothetical protein
MGIVCGKPEGPAVSSDSGGDGDGDGDGGDDERLRNPDVYAETRRVRAIALDRLPAHWRRRRGKNGAHCARGDPGTYVDRKRYGGSDRRHLPSRRNSWHASAPSGIACVDGANVRFVPRRAASLADVRRHKRRDLHGMRSSPTRVEGDAPLSAAVAASVAASAAISVANTRCSADRRAASLSTGDRGQNRDACETSSNCVCVCACARDMRRDAHGCEGKKAAGCGAGGGGGRRPAKQPYVGRPRVVPAQRSCRAQHAVTSIEYRERTRAPHNPRDRVAHRRKKSRAPTSLGEP